MIICLIGEAQYINDMCPEKGELFAAFVLSTVANATLKNIDPSEAMVSVANLMFDDNRDV
jgi:xanthine dehydrogenase molybdopterin-binding subunit B